MEKNHDLDGYLEAVSDLLTHHDVINMLNVKYLITYPIPKYYTWRQPEIPEKDPLSPLKGLEGEREIVLLNTGYFDKVDIV